jgi:error-prone DNA polymerase
MAFNNPSWTWSELEATLSGRRGRDGRAPGSPSWNAGGDSPAWGRKRQQFDAPLTRVPGTVPYAELHCHSNFSFLDGASHPEELATEAARLGLEALALTDHNGFYGVVRFAEAAREVGLPTVFGAEITLTPGLDDERRVARSEADTLPRSTPASCPTRTPPIRTVATSSCWPTGRPATHAWRGRSASGTWRGRRGRHSSPSPTSPTR